MLKGELRLKQNVEVMEAETGKSEMEKCKMGKGEMGKPESGCPQPQYSTCMYLPMSGTASEVGGIVSATSSRNTISDSSIVVPERTEEAVKNR